MAVGCPCWGPAQSSPLCAVWTGPHQGLNCVYRYVEALTASLTTCGDGAFTEVMRATGHWGDRVLVRSGCRRTPRTAL